MTASTPEHTEGRMGVAAPLRGWHRGDPAGERLDDMTHAINRAGTMMMAPRMLLRQVRGGTAQGGGLQTKVFTYGALTEFGQESDANAHHDEEKSVLESTLEPEKI